MSFRDAAPLLRARSVAIVGASPGARWVDIFLEQIPKAGFRGPIWPVHPSHKAIGDLRCYPSVRDTPQVPELAILHVSTERTVAVLEEAAAAGVKSAAIYSTGWAEMGEAGRARQEALARLVERSGLRLCGPNCLGFLSVREGLIAYPLRILEWLKAGGIGAVFQSGALLYPFVRAAGERGAGFSYLVSCGNEVGLDAADYMKFLIDDPETRAIALLLEGVRAPGKFRAALELALEAGKPVSVMKVGRTERSQASALTHTGALAGSNRVFEALCERYGVARCDGLEQLVETSRLAAIGRRPAGRRAAVLLFSGSLRSHVMDCAPEAGIELAQPAAATMQSIAAMDATLDVRIANPFDCGVLNVNQPKYLEVAGLLAADPNVDAVLIEEHPPDPKRGRSGAALAKLAAQTQKPVVVVSETSYSRTAYVEQLIAEAAGVPFMQGLERGLKAVGGLMAHVQAKRRHGERRLPAAAGTRPLAKLGAGLHGLGAIGEALLSYGLPVVPQRVAPNLDQAVAAAEAIGYPVALKIESPDIAHKSDAGGVRLGIADAQALRSAWDDMHAEVKRRAPDARLAGALVARMSGPGLEMSLGVQRDPQFGLALMVGLGGVWIEVFQDVSLRLLPIEQSEARGMLAEIKAAPLLGAFRGAAPRDVDALVAAMVALARFAQDHADRLESVEINPLIVHEEGKGASAVDARMVLA